MLLTLLLGCVLGPRPDACSANSDCRDGFGFGNVCGEDGYCTTARDYPRCATTFPEDLFEKPEQYDDAFIAGSIFNMPFDEKQQRSAELAFRNVDVGELDGGPYDRKVAIVHCDNSVNRDYDDLDSVRAAADAASFLVDELGVQVIVGPSTSDESFAVFGSASVGGALTISPSATSPALTDVGGLPTEEDPGLFWRTAPPDDLQALVIAEDLSERGVQTILIVHQLSSYATSLAEAVEAGFVGSGGSAEVLSYDNLSELTELIVTVFNNPAEEVVFFTSETNEVVEFLDLAADDGNIGRTIFLADAAADSVLFDVTSGAEMLPTVRGTRPQIPTGDLVETFELNYNAVYEDLPTDSVFTSYTFDAAWLALYGGLWAEANGEPLTGAAVGKAILAMSDTEAPTHNVGYSSVDELREAFEAGETVNLEGVSGDLDYDPTTGEVSNPIEVWVVDTENEAFDPVKLCLPGGSCEDITKKTGTKSK